MRITTYAALLTGCALLATQLIPSYPEAAGDIVFLDQGPSWTDAHRTRFYSEDQGSRLIPLAWLRALQTADGAGFLNDALARYGYLPNPDGPVADLPVGFTAGDGSLGEMAGMTCSACHTRQIEVDGTAYRVDGGPAMVDFQAFLADLDTAVGTVLDSDEAFDAFAGRVLGEGHSETDSEALRIQVDGWHLRHHEYTSRSLPEPPWGPGRLDAVGMIFNRLAGLDIGPPPFHLIPENIVAADSPTRYPFLWNAARQDRTQWPGFAANGNDLLGLARNLGEVYGVFAEFHPRPSQGIFAVLSHDYLSGNSANFSGLQNNEDLIWQIGPPAWPWEIDEEKAARGEEIFARPPEAGGCAECHRINTEDADRRFTLKEIWHTPVQDVDTDARQCRLLARTVKTGTLEGAHVPVLSPDPLKAEDLAIDTLKVAVLGSITQRVLSLRGLGVGPQAGPPPEFEMLKGAFPADGATLEALAAAPADRPRCAYEARVLQGIWAAAPYLHNGSVPTLADLLKPAAERPASFEVGPVYDPARVGLAATQPQFGATLETTGCDAPDSGNSRCGHEYGTDTLSEDERDALLEYLKTL